MVAWKTQEMQFPAATQLEPHIRENDSEQSAFALVIHEEVRNSISIALSYSIRIVYRRKEAYVRFRHSREGGNPV